MADAAGQAKVELVVTLFTGHMSGVNWIPAWATGGGYRDPRFRVIAGGRVQPGEAGLRNWYADPGIAAVEHHAADEADEGDHPHQHEESHAAERPVRGQHRGK